MNDYYIYVYIDPRNFEEFYYGKGKGSRKDSHLKDKSDSEKVRRIAAIEKAGLKPIIRVVARDLSNHDALLVEKTLLWKLGHNLTNISSGNYGKNFRPHNTMHQDLTGFDFQNGIYHYNTSDGINRCWEDYINFGFISAGQGGKWRDAIKKFQTGDVVAAYLNRHGYVGIGQIKEQAKPVRNVMINGKPLLSQNLQCRGLGSNSASDERCEYVATVKWLSKVSRETAKQRKPLRGVRASLENQPATIKFLEKEFGISNLSTFVK